MASKTDIFLKSNDAGLKLFRFTLMESSMDDLVLYHAPDGWDDYTIELIRHKEYNSVLRTSAEIDLVFYKEGRQFIKTVYIRAGVEGDITLLVERLNLTTYEYEVYPAPTKISLASYLIDEVSVAVKLVDDSFKEKVFNREDIDVDILKLKSIEGYNIEPFDTESIVIPDLSIDNDDIATLTGLPVSSSSPFVVPISSVTNNDFTAEMRVPTSTVPDTLEAAFFLSSATSRVLTISGDLQCDIRDAISVDYRLVVLDSSGAVVAKYGVYENSWSLSGDYIFDISFSKQILLNKGESITFQCVYSALNVATSYHLTITEIYEAPAEKSIPAYMDYEVFLRICQIITNLDNPFKSDFFGRLDTPLTTYTQDGELGALTKGIFIRTGTGINISNTIAVSLKDYFKAKSAQYRLGLGIEQKDGVNKVVVENLDYFYTGLPVLDISDRLRPEDIKVAAIPERYYNSAIFGYKKYEYDRSAGALEFNTVSTWTTVLKSIFTSISKICNIRADGQGIMNLLNASSADDYDITKDVKGDDDLFLISCYRDELLPTLIARTNQGFDYIGGIVYANKLFNIIWSPARNLLRYGADIKAGLKKHLNSFIRWQSTDKNNTLESRLTTETNTVYENGDILANNLNDSLWEPEGFTVTVPLSNAEMRLLYQTPNKYITCSESDEGWILSAKTKVKDNMTEFHLLRRKAV